MNSESLMSASKIWRKGFDSIDNNRVLLLITVSRNALYTKIAMNKIGFGHYAFVVYGKFLGENSYYLIAVPPPDIIWDERDKIQSLLGLKVLYGNRKKRILEMMYGPVETERSSDGGSRDDLYGEEVSPEPDITVDGSDEVILEGIHEKPEEGTLISLKESIYATVAGNLLVKIAKIETQIKNDEVAAIQSEFDSRVKADIGLKQDKLPLAGALVDPEVSDISETELSLGIGKKLETGAETDLTFASSTKQSNSRYSGLDPLFNSSLTLTVTQPLLRNFGRVVNKSAVLVALSDKKISNANFKKQLTSSVADTINSYWDLVYERELLDVQKESLVLAETFKKNIQYQVSVGTMAKYEILQADAEVAARKENVIIAKNRVKKAMNALRSKTNIVDLPRGEYKSALIPSDKPIYIKREFVEAEKVAVAIAKRPELVELKQQINKEKIQVKYYENQIYPSLDLEGSFGLNGLSGDAKSFTLAGDETQSTFSGDSSEGVSRMLSGDYYSWKVGVTVEYPFGNRKSKNMLHASRLRAQQVLVNMKNAENEISFEVVDLLGDYRTNIERVESTKRSKELAVQKLAAEEKKLKAGLSSSFTVMNYQRDLASQKEKSLSAIIDLNKSLAMLDVATGELLDVWNVEIE